jgi:hypothetical protein
MQYSPKLKNAMSEIKDILVKYDIAGLVVLHTDGYGDNEGFGEYLLKIDPSYSVAKLEDSETVRFKARLKEDFNGNKRLMEYKLAATANMLNILTIKGGSMAMALMDLSEKFDKITGAEHGTGTNTSQSELDN